jgi:hypothetical protein
MGAHTAQCGNATPEGAQLRGCNLCKPRTLWWIPCTPHRHHAPLMNLSLCKLSI